MYDYVFVPLLGNIEVLLTLLVAKLLQLSR
jgi:hypothetical protein